MATLVYVVYETFRHCSATANQDRLLHYRDYRILRRYQAHPYCNGQAFVFELRIVVFISESFFFFFLSLLYAPYVNTLCRQLPQMSYDVFCSKFERSKICDNERCLEPMRRARVLVQFESRTM